MKFPCSRRHGFSCHTDSHPRQFAWLSKQRSCRRGSWELIGNKRDTRGQKGQSRKQNAENRRQKGWKSPRRKDIEPLGGAGVENSRPMLSPISYSVKSFYSIY